MDSTEFYYYNIGLSPSNRDREITNKTFDYLLDNNFSEVEILSIIKDLPIISSISPKDLPDYIWEGSLLKRDTFYYHSELHITSPPPYYDFVGNKVISNDFFIEMRIKYTTEDISNYFYKNFFNQIEFKNDKKDNGAIEFLLKSYSTFSFIEPVDFVLFLIDEAYSLTKDDENSLNEILDLKRFQSNTLAKLKQKVISAKSEKKNIIIWR